MIENCDLNDQFSMLFRAAPNGAMALDPSGRIIHLNVQIEKMFGYSYEELTGQSVELLVPGRFRKRHVDLRKQFSVSPQMRLLGTNRDLVAARKDGSEFPVEIGLNSVATPKGNAVVATVVDISRRRRATNEEDVAERVQGRLQVLQQLGMAAAVLEQDGRVVETNLLFNDFHSQFVFKNGRIGVSDSIADKFFKQALASLDGNNRIEIQRSHPVLAANGRTSVILHILSLEGSLGSGLGILIVKAVGTADPIFSDLVLVQSIFGLAPAEARVAALIGSGLSPRQAGVKLGISVKNVRTTLQHIFTKVGISRQSELAVLITKLGHR